MYCPNCGHEAGQASIYCARCGRRLGNPPTGDEESSKSTPTMKGRVVAFDWRTNDGVISGANGNSYNFTGQDWRSDRQPQLEMSVEFLPEDRYARNVYGSSISSPQSVFSQRTVVGILGILLGSLGIHKFVLGYTTEGFILLLAGTVGWLVVAPAVAAIVIGIVEGVIYLTKSDEEFHGTYIQQRKAWF